MPDIWEDVDSAVIVPVNIMPLLDDTDFKTIETAVVYNSAGLALTWNFVTSAGVVTGTAVTPTTAGVYDWSEPIADKGMYAIEIPASGGGSINNDAEGYGWFTGVATGVLPWRGPMIGFRAAGLNDKLCDSAYDATRALAGTALPAAAADAAGGLPISDAGGLDLDAQVKTAIDAVKLATDNLPSAVKKNTARVIPFKMVLSSDHQTPATGLTVTAERALDTAVTFTACAGAVTEKTSGWYHLSAAAGDLNGDAVALKFTAATADQVDIVILTEP